MPIVNFYLVEDRYDDADVAQLLIDSSHFYLETLYPGVTPPPLERVRAFVTTVQAQHWATAGKLASDGGANAPYFTCLALAGRPDKQLHDLMAGFTELVVKHLGVGIAHVRGQVISIEPSHWSIGGVPASIKRSDEAELRAGVG
jgi:phenylpyruvate tautomerase PptA (4-oxalocrotonate tautomerase family)